MNKIKSMKLFIALSDGLSFLAIIILSHWSATFKLSRLDGSYTGKEAFLSFGLQKCTQRIPVSISVKYNDINCHRISNDIHFVLRFHRPRSAINPFFVLLAQVLSITYHTLITLYGLLTKCKVKMDRYWRSFFF